MGKAHISVRQCVSFRTKTASELHTCYTKAGPQFNY